jgi:hypothetical protein
VLKLSIAHYVLTATMSLSSSLAVHGVEVGPGARYVPGINTPAGQTVWKVAGTSALVLFLNHVHQKGGPKWLVPVLYVAGSSVNVWDTAHNMHEVRRR